MTRPEHTEIEVAENLGLPVEAVSPAFLHKPLFDIRGLLLDFVCGLVLLACVLFPFAGTFQSGKTVSSIGLLQQIDYLQNPARTEPFFITKDPSASLLHIPNELFYKQCSSEIPLWNPLNGAGRPFIGDFQTLLFSFFHTYFPVDNAALYNWAILSKLVLGSLGAYLLARFCGLSRISSLMIGQAFVLCGRSLNLLELCDNACFYPWSILMAMWATSKKSIHRPALFALFVAALAYNMHPETFFCAASVGYLVLLLRAYSMWSGSLQKRAAMATLFCLSSATVSLLVAAPLLVTFVEFVKNGMSYKFQDEKVAFVSLWSFVSESFAPYDGTGCYMGAAVAILLPVGAFFLWKKQRELAIVAALTFVFITRPGALENILSMAPFSYFLPTYAQMVLILMALLSAGLSLDVLSSPASKPMLKEVCNSFWTKAAYAVWLALGSAFFLLQVPFVNNFLCDKTDFIYDLASVEKPVLLASLFSVFVSAAIVFAIFKLKSPKSAVQTGLVAALAINNAILVEVCASKFLPVQEASWYQKPAIIQELARVQENSPFRTIASSYDVFIPCANMVFGLDNFGSTSPLHPTRYANYSRLMGLRDAFCNIAECPREVNHLFDLASIKYIVSKKPLAVANANQELALLPSFPFLKPDSQAAIEQVVAGEERIQFKDARKLAPALRINSADLRVNKSHGQITGKVCLTIHQMGSRVYNYQILLKASNNATVWSSYPRREPIEDLSRKLKDNVYEIPVAVSIPKSAESPLKLILSVRHGFAAADASELVLAELDMTESIAPNRAASNTSDVVSNTVSNADAEPTRTDRFNVVFESTDGLRLYENLAAKANCYLVHEADLVGNAKESFESIKSPAKDWKNGCVLEVSEADKKRAVQNGFTAGFEFLKQSTDNKVSLGAPSGTDVVRILDKSANVVSVLALSEKPSFLILTDTFYPGWQVTVDSKPSHIFAANHAFRAVYIPSGRHFVSFEFKPANLDWRLMIAGLLIGFGAVIAGLFLSFGSKKKD